jgi:hypothetical protein
MIDLNGHSYRSHDDIKAMLVTCHLLGEYAMDYFVHEVTHAHVHLGTCLLQELLALQDDTDETVIRLKRIYNF